MSELQPQELSGVGCPNCGGAIEWSIGTTVASCRHCNTKHAVVEGRGIFQSMVLDRVDRDQAETSLRRWWSDGWTKHRALPREAALEEAFLAFFPFVRTRFNMVGWHAGMQRVRRSNNQTTLEHTNLPTVETHDETEPAAEMAEFGVRRVDLTGDQIVPCREEILVRRGMVFRPRVAADERLRAAMQTAVETARANKKLERVDFAWVEAVAPRVSVVYYPLWVFRYRFHGRIYQALIDAEDGRLWVGKAPGNDLFRAFAIVAGSAGACFLGTTFLQHPDIFLSSDDDGALGLLVAIGAALAGMVYWGWRAFRRGGLVEEGPGFTANANPLEKRLKNWLSSRNVS